MEWVKIFYKDIKDFYNLYIFLLVLGIGIFMLLEDYPALKKKKLKKDSKICKIIGISYILGGVGLYIILKIF